MFHVRDIGGVNMQYNPVPNLLPLNETYYTSLRLYVVLY